MIVTFDTLDEAILHIEGWEHISLDYFKVELFRTDDNRWRVGIITERQYELKFESETMELDI